MTTDQPRRGDAITTAEQFDEFFDESGVEYVVVVEQGGRPWLVTSTEDGDLYAWSWREEGGSGEPVITTEGLNYPLTLLALPPGEQSPSVEDARAVVTVEQRDEVADLLWDQMVGAAKSVVRKVVAEAFEFAKIEVGR